MKLAVKKRELTGKKVKSLRKEGLIPAVVYGKHVEPQSISCIKNDFLRIYKTAGYTTPIELKGEVDQLVLLQSLQLDPVTDELLTIDFLAVSRTEKVTADIPVVMVGESPLEKLNEGRVQLVKDTVEVEAFPQDLPSSFEVDISVIETVNDVVFVKDLKAGSKVEIIDDLELPILTVAILSDEPEEEELAEVTETTEDTGATSTEETAAE
ncbi:MAG: 50S ribosomal protein L25 [Candidatus Absconditabacteria bacterium]|nr:50S ribosomal protein L25 [Candidatus Absconditabacteria bacterium]MDD3868576.1 50S ribosomal protein L25 [Candidatus Absconditabacteria bacterium]MDD4714755.1 50S ribosomal protein L25 [Candidatus Absconditabacteria bacterium]